VERFAEIFDGQPLDFGSRAKALDGMAEAADWTVLYSGDSVRLADNTHSIAISGVPWSKPDLEVLDELAARDAANTRVWFFNPDKVFPDARILPAAPRMLQTPTLAEYSGGRLVDFAQGGSVVDRIRKLFRSR
jgi:hypothetical protein